MRIRVVAQARLRPCQESYGTVAGRLLRLLRDRSSTRQCCSSPPRARARNCFFGGCCGCDFLMLRWIYCCTGLPNPPPENSPKVFFHDAGIELINLIGPVVVGRRFVAHSHVRTRSLQQVVSGGTACAQKAPDTRMNKKLGRYRDITESLRMRLENIERSP